MWPYQFTAVAVKLTLLSTTQINHIKTTENEKSGYVGTNT